MDSVASVNSVGNYNSETSHHSGYSDEFWNYLSVEERECLMFLEETIDSLNIEELEQTETVSTENGSQSENLSPPCPENPYFQTTEPVGRIPRAVSHFGKDSTDSTSPQVVESKSGSNTLPKYNSKPSSESASSESSSNLVSFGETRRRSHSTTIHLSVESKDDKVKLGPPTAPKPGKLPPNIILRSWHRNKDLVSPPHSIFKASKDSLRSNGASKEGSTEGEAEHVRKEALAKLGLLSDVDGRKRNQSNSVKTSTSQMGTGGDEKKTNHPEAVAQENKLHSLTRPSIAASSAGPGVTLASGKPANVGLGNMNAHHWQLPATKSSSLQRFNTPGENIPPTTSLSSARYTSANAALNAGTSKTLPNLKRSTNFNEGHTRKISLPPWPLGSSKANSLKRFGTPGDSSQLASCPGLVRNTSVTGAANVPGLNKLPKQRPMSICSEADLSSRHGTTLEEAPNEKPAGKFFPIKINHISAKSLKSPPKGLHVQVVPQGPTSKDHKEALRKLGLLKE